MVSVFNRDVEVSWQAPATDTNTPVAEYRLSYGTSSNSYDNVVTTSGDQTQQTLSLAAGDYFLTITSVDSVGLESAPAGEVVFRVQ